MFHLLEHNKSVGQGIINLRAGHNKPAGQGIINLLVVEMAERKKNKADWQKDCQTGLKRHTG